MWVTFFQNDSSDILGLTFSMDADEEKHILYEKTEVCPFLATSADSNVDSFTNGFSLQGHKSATVLVN
jgi:hypothetical protein